MLLLFVLVKLSQQSEVGVRGLHNLQQKQTSYITDKKVTATFIQVHVSIQFSHILDLLTTKVPFPKLLRRQG